MKILKDCSEVREARELLLEIMRELVPDGAASVASRSHPPAEIAEQPATLADLESIATDESVVESATGRMTSALLPWTADEPAGWAVVEPAAPQPAGVSDQRKSIPEDSSRSDQLHSILAILCDREGLVGALVTDSGGLPLAASISIEANESLAAFSTVLGDALLKAGSYLGHDEASDVALDINSKQKLVLHRFNLEERPHYLLVLCEPTYDPRSAMRGVVPEILSVLAVS